MSWATQRCEVTVSLSLERRSEWCNDFHAKKSASRQQHHRSSATSSSSWDWLFILAGQCLGSMELWVTLQVTPQFTLIRLGLNKKRMLTTGDLYTKGKFSRWLEVRLFVCREKSRRERTQPWGNQCWWSRIQRHPSPASSADPQKGSWHRSLKSPGAGGWSWEHGYCIFYRPVDSVGKLEVYSWWSVMIWVFVPPAHWPVVEFKHRPVYKTHIFVFLQMLKNDSRSGEQPCFHEAQNGRWREVSFPHQ